MQTTVARFVQRGALAASAALLLATGASAAGGAPAPTTYRLIPLSPGGGSADINATGQVAFTQARGGQAPRAFFYDGRTRQDIGTLGGPSASAVALNDAGQVVGVSTTRKGVPHAFRWSKATGMIDLAAPGSGYSSAAAINNKGWVTGSADFTPGNRTAFRWTPGAGMVNLGSLGQNSAGVALNDAGIVVGASDTAPPGQGRQAVRWPGTTPIPITPEASPFASAFDINNAGQIVGDSISSAFLWSPQDGFTDLGISYQDFPRAEQVTEKGVVLGNLYRTNGTIGFVWRRTTGAIALGTRSVDASVARDINSRGQVVGHYNYRAFVWTRTEGVVDLNTRLVNAPPGLRLVQAVAISDNGAIVAAGNTGLVLLVPQAGSQNAPPVAAPITLTGTPRVNALLSFSAAFTDVDLRDTHKAEWSWGDDSKTVGTVSEKNGAGNVSGQHAFQAAGIYTVRLTVTDSSGNSSTVQRTVVVCASSAAVIAGEGSFISPRAALGREPHAGIAQFAFLLDANGKVAVQFEVGSMAFHGATINSVTLADARLRFSGTGTLNGSEGYRYTLTASDGAGAQDGKHRFGIRISHLDPVTKQEVVDYDNLAAAQEGSAVSEGSMLIGAR